MPMIALSRDWICDGCEKSNSDLNDKGRAGIRWDCKYCKDASLVSGGQLLLGMFVDSLSSDDGQCMKCIKKVEKKHKKHHHEDDFTPVLYPALYTPDVESD
jgi:hypothetical protein